MMPAEVLVVDKLPLLGSGKVDNVAVTKLVHERVAAQAKPAAVASGCVAASRRRQAASTKREGSRSAGATASA